MNRRNILLSGAVMAVGFALPGLPPLGTARAEPSEVTERDRVLGPEDAPVTIIEYASLTCSHCGSFHNETWPSVKRDWIDTGKARLVFRHYPLDRLALFAAMAVNCLPTRRAQFALIDVLFKNQYDWSRAPEPLAELSKLSRLAGMSEERFYECLEDQSEMDLILNDMVAARDAFGVESTPTFIVNGRKVEGALPFEEFEQVLVQALDGS